MKSLALGGMVLGAVVTLVVACGPPPAVIEVTLSQTSFATSGGNLFNCGTPAYPATARAVDPGPITCTPKRLAGGGFSTTPVVVTERVGCGDGLGAFVMVTCQGTATGTDVTGSVVVGIGSSCDSSDGIASPGAPIDFDLMEGGQQSGMSSACQNGSNLCPTSDACAFNALAATVTVSRTMVQ